MLIKRPIYNKSLACVAYEIVAQQNQQDNEQFILGLTQLIQVLDKSIPIFIPLSIQHHLIDEPAFAEYTFIVKIHAKDLEKRIQSNPAWCQHLSLSVYIDELSQLIFLNYADYITLNEAFISTSDAQKIIKLSHTKQRKVMAYNIVDNDNLKFAQTLNVDFYCGDFLYKPNQNTNSQMASSKITLISLINLLHNKDAHFDDIAKNIQNDPVLSYQLLRLVNSAAFSGYSIIESVQQAVVRLGFTHLKNWALMISMKNISNKPIELIESALIRAHMSELLAKANPCIQPDVAYTTGLLSVLDSLLDTPMNELIEKISVSDETVAALLRREGPLGELLNIVAQYEEGHWDSLTSDHYHGIDLSLAYIDCLSKVSENKALLTA